MRSWNSPDVPQLPALQASLQLFDTASDALVPVETPDDVGSLYVCGITPYDATHLGHANTYVHFDLLVRYWLASGVDVRYVQNVTDIDDPLLDRATATEVDWRDLAEDQTELFRQDMAALDVIAPGDFLGAVETIPQVVEDVERLVDLGVAYRVPVPTAEAAQAGQSSAGDVYFDIAAAESSSPWQLGSIGNYTRPEMEELFPERGGDPERVGKRDALDPLLWRARRAGEPYWDGASLGEGRPGWHIECSVIARRHLPAPFTVQGGGSDLRFPHHEFSAAHATAADGLPLAKCYLHAGMVGLDGSKMSKSRGNLVLVSALRERGADPQVIRTVLLEHHYREDWSFTDGMLESAAARLARWNEALASAPKVPADQGPADQSPAGQGRTGQDQTGQPVVASAPNELQYALHSALSLNLNAPAALDQLDMWARGHLAQGVSQAEVRRTVQALLGIRLGEA